MSVNDFDIEMAPAHYMLFLTYADKPGVIGQVGTILGRHEINIGTMDVGRASSGGTALMGLTLDSPVAPDVVGEVGHAVGVETIRFIVLPE
jgi:D-3-phosphoglycerate dehydrogenase